MRRHALFAASLLGAVGLVACNFDVGHDYVPSEDPPLLGPAHLPSGEWGELAKVWDLPEQAQTSVPWVELGAPVQAKVVVGGVRLESSDPSVFIVESYETVLAGQLCELFSRCRPDFDTHMTLRGLATGDANLIVDGPLGDERSLPLHVGERETVEIVEAIDSSTRPSVVESTTIESAWLELLVKDGRGHRLATHTVWEIENTEVARFAPLFWLFGDTFSVTEPGRHEGPMSFIEFVSAGETTLRVTSETGIDLSIPVRTID